MASDVRRTCATVDLAALQANYHTLKQHVDGRQVFAVVKADAYGLGMLPVAHALQNIAADGVCVALLEEALELRGHQIDLPIIVLNGIYGSAHRAVIDHNLIPIVFDLENARAFASASNRPLAVHLKVDTGMARLGVPFAEWQSFLDGFAKLPKLVLAGMMTHFSSAWDDPETTAAQLACFEHAIAAARARGFEPSVLHAANSAAALRYPESRYNAVRSGIALYGVGDGMRPVLRLVAEVVSIRTIPVGAPVGYNCRFRAQRPTRVATVSIGYGDGYPRALANTGKVLVHGTRCPVIGDVSMDLIGVDVTDVADVKRGDEVCLIGMQESASITLAEIASWADTIPYEILTRLTKRVPRHYLATEQTRSI